MQQQKAGADAANTIAPSDFAATWKPNSAASALAVASVSSPLEEFDPDADEHAHNAAAPDLVVSTFASTVASMPAVPRPVPPPAIAHITTVTPAEAIRSDANSWFDAMVTQSSERDQPSAAAMAMAVRTYATSASSPVTRALKRKSLKRKQTGKVTASAVHSVQFADTGEIARNSEPLTPSPPAEPRASATHLRSAMKNPSSHHNTLASSIPPVVEPTEPKTISTAPAATPSETRSASRERNSSTGFEPASRDRTNDSLDHKPRIHVKHKDTTFLTSVDVTESMAVRSRRSSVTLINSPVTDNSMEQEEGDLDDVDPASRAQAELNDFAEWLTDEVPYKLQGDEHFYTPEALAARGALVKHPRILKLIDKFWKSLRGLDMKFGLMRDEFVTLQVKMAKVIDPQWSIADAERTAVAEFQKEVGKSVGLTKEKFFRSLFELVDTWTSTIDAVDYIYFLQELFRRLTISRVKTVHGFDHTTNQATTSVVEVHEFRDLKDVRAWKDLPFFYQAVDKEKYRRLQQQQQLGPLLPESEESAESQVSESEDPVKLEAAKERKRQQFKAEKEAIMAADLARDRERAEATRKLRGQNYQPLEGSAGWLSMQKDVDLDPDALLGKVEGEDASDVDLESDPEDEDAEKQLSSDASWSSETDSTADDPNAPILSEDEAFYGKREGEYSKFEPAPYREPQTVELHKPKPPPESEAPLPLTAEELARRDLQARLKKHRPKPSQAPSIMFPEGMIDLSGKRKPAASSDSEAATATDGGGDGAATAGETATDISGSETLDDSGQKRSRGAKKAVVIGEGETVSTITGAKRKKFRVKEAKGLHDDAAAALKRATDHLGKWEKIQADYRALYGESMLEGPTEEDQTETDEAAKRKRALQRKFKAREKRCKRSPSGKSRVNRKKSRG